MRVRPTKRAIFIIFIFIIIAASAAVFFSGSVTRRSGLRVGYIGGEGWGSWWGSYALLDGKMWRTLHLDSSQSTLHIETETQSGELFIDIKDGSGNIIFSSGALGTDSFDINASGSIKVTITAKNHKGSFRLE